MRTGEQNGPAPRFWERVHLLWLEGELPRLVGNGVLTEESSERLRRHYRLEERASFKPLAVVVLAVVGSAFIGAGVILLVAHNWQDLARPMRTALAFAPLAAAQLLGLWALWRREHSDAWKESSAILVTAGVCASIALVGQIYHIPGDAAEYLRACGALALPLAYLFASAAASAFSMIALTSWIAGADYFAEPSPWFWLLFGLAAAPAARFWVRQGARVRGTLLAWVFCASLTAGVLSVLGRLPEEPLWGVVPPLFFLSLYLLAQGPVRLPQGSAFLAFGLGGLVIMALMSTFTGYWEHLPAPPDWGKVGWHAWGILLGTLGGCGLVLAYVARRAGWVTWSVAGLAALLIAAHLPGLCLEELPPWLCWTGAAAMNLYLFASSLALMAAGLRRGGFLETNGGLAIIAMLGLLRFFDADLPFTLRGLLFVVIGLGFLTVNWVLTRRRRQRRRAAA